MSWTNVFPAWLRGPQSSRQVSQEIDEELLFHLRARVEDNLKAGMSSDAAWEDARVRFGSLRYYSDTCRDDQRTRGIWSGVVGIALMACLLVGAWLVFGAGARKGDAAQNPNQAHTDLVGAVVNQRNEPVAGAKSLVILKTWPNNQYRQDDFSAETDAQGKFILKQLIPDQGQCAVHVAVLKPGYTLASSYQLRKQGDQIALDKPTLQLDEAVAMKLVVQDAQGQPIAGAHVIPAARRAANGTDHVVYFQGAKPVEAVTDANGRVPMGYFQRRDQAKVFLQVPGQDWKEYSVVVPETGDTMVISANQGPPAGK